MRKCRQCGATYDLDVEICKYCGSSDTVAVDKLQAAVPTNQGTAANAHRTSNKKTAWIIAAAIAIPILVVAVIFGVIGINKDAKNRQIKEEYMVMAENRIEENDYLGAVAVLQSALEQIDDDRELKSKIAEYRSQYISLTIEEYVATGDYGSAIELLNENEDFVNGDTNLQIRRSELIAKYKEKLFADAEQLYENEGYKCAIILLKDGLKVAGTSDAEILDKISFYNDLAPVNLSSLSPFNQDASSWGHIETHDDVVDNMGNTYT